MVTKPRAPMSATTYDNHCPDLATEQGVANGYYLLHQPTNASYELGP